jgi:outer membrane receptor protein involved in Fe transport
MSRKSLRVLVLIALAGWSTMVPAQVTTGTILGTVADSSGAVLPGAKIEIMSEGTGAIRTVTSDATGHYIVPTLPVGNYRASASMQGFQTEVRSGISLNIGAQITIDMKLQVGAVTQSVEVTGEAPLVQTQESTVSYLVSGDTLRDLPLNGRDMSQLILLNPGVTLSVNSNGGTSFSGYGKRISIAGMRGEDNIYVLDGGLIGDFRRHIPAGPSGSLLGLESTQEFQVLTNSLGAQYGRMLGGVFNAVSRSGTNEWHGSAYDFLRNSSLDAAKWEDNARGGGLKSPLRRNQFGASFGGPIKKDKMFFFAAYESTREALTQTLTSNTITAAARQDNGLVPVVSPAIKPYLAQWPLPTPGGKDLGGGVAEFTRQFKQPTTEHFGQIRVDWQISPNDSFFTRYTGSNSFRDSSAGFPGFDQVSTLGASLATLSETHIFSPVTLNTVRFHFNRVNPLDTGSYPAPLPGVQIVPGLPLPIPPNLSPGSGVSSYGGFDTAPTRMLSNRFTFQDDVNLTRGAHALQVGGLLERLQFNGSFWNRYEGIWSWANLSAFLATGLTPGPTNETQFRGAPPGYGTYERGFRSWSFALYAQDNWRLTDRLTLNLGLRWEPYTVPTEVNNLISNLRHITDTKGSVGSPYWQNVSWKDFAPRLGFAWSPFASGRTSVRGGAGLFFAPNDPNLYYTQMVRNPPLAYDFTIPGTGHFPDAIAEIAAQSTQGPGYAVPFDNMQEQHSFQYNFTVQHQLGASDVLSVGYAGSRGIDLLSVGDINMPQATFDGVALAMPIGATLVNSAYSSIVLYANNTNSWYNGLLTSYQHRFSKGMQAQVAYTWSKGLAEADSGQTAGGVTGGGGRMKYPADHHAQRGLSGYNFTHVFTFSYSYDILSGMKKGGVLGAVLTGWQTTGVLNLRTGQSQSVTTSVPTATCGTGCASLNALAVTPVSPNAVAGCTPVIHSRNPEHYFDTDCFTGITTNTTDASGVARPTVGVVLPNRELGNLGRNTLIGPGAITWNPAVFKTFSVTERLKLEFRTEMFNVLNRANYGPPASSLFSASGVPTAGVGRINTTTTESRQIQFALKLTY